jgi:hypothetical protein
MAASLTSNSLARSSVGVSGVVIGGEEPAHRFEDEAFGHEERGREYVGFDFFPDAWGTSKGTRAAARACLFIRRRFAPWCGYGRISRHDHPR